jgi:hypothetical protein
MPKGRVSANSGSHLRSGVKPLGVQINDWFLLVVEPDTVSGTQNNLQNRSKSSFVSAGCLFVNDNTRADVEFSMPFSFFHVVPSSGASSYRTNYGRDDRIDGWSNQESTVGFGSFWRFWNVDAIASPFSSLL